MPNRIIKESICVSEEIDSLSWFEEVLFYRLIVKCDDFGRYDGRSKVIKGQCFPLKDTTARDVEKALEKLSAAGLVVRYSVCGHPFLQLTTWEKHQSVRNKKSKYPSPDEADSELNTVEINCNQLHANVPVIQSNPNPNPNPNPNTNPSKVRFAPPTLNELEEYIRENNFVVDAQRFLDYYEANGWMIGSHKMKDWKATVRNWDRREQEKFQTEQNTKKKGGLTLF